MLRAARQWAPQAVRALPGLQRLGIFGGYARGDWGVGSDLDLVAIVGSSEEPFERRALAVDLSVLPVPAELLVFTEAEWRTRVEGGDRLAASVEHEAVWLIDEESRGTTARE